MGVEAWEDLALTVVKMEKRMAELSAVELNELEEYFLSAVARIQNEKSAAKGKRKADASVDGHACGSSASKKPCDHAHASGQAFKNDMLSLIIQELRRKVPKNAEAPNEKFVYPEDGEFANYAESNCVNVDGLLYDNDEVDEMCQNGDIPTDYCRSCGSRDIEKLNFVSHSLSRESLEILFHYLGDLKGKTLVDVGSRLGGVLYGAFVLSECSTIIGVEMSEYFCGVQKEMVKNFKMEERIKVVNSKVEEVPDTLRSADVVVLNNVFEFFVDKAELARMWQFIRDTCRKKGTLIVTNPSLQTSLARLSKEDRDAVACDDWVEFVVELGREEEENDEQEGEGYSDLYVYRVK